MLQHGGLEGDDNYKDYKDGGLEASKATTATRMRPRGPHLCDGWHFWREPGSYTYIHIYISPSIHPSIHTYIHTGRAALHNLLALITGASPPQDGKNSTKIFTYHHISRVGRGFMWSLPRCPQMTACRGRCALLVKFLMLR